MSNYYSYITKGSVPPSPALWYKQDTPPCWVPSGAGTVGEGEMAIRKEILERERLEWRKWERGMKRGGNGGGDCGGGWVGPMETGVGKKRFITDLL